jgi:hypothetical protein
MNKFFTLSGGVIPLSLTALLYIIVRIYLSPISASLSLSIPLLFLIVWQIAHSGHVHVPDNMCCPKYRFGNYISCVGPGHHFGAWPVDTWGELIDTRYSSTECWFENAYSTDRAPFKLTLLFSYRFKPDLIKSPQVAQEFISIGTSGREISAQTVAQSAALYIIRSQSHIQLFSGFQQTLIQGQVAQETAVRLEKVGLEVSLQSFRVFFTGPKEIDMAFTAEHASRPNVQAELTHLKEFLDTFRKYATPEVQQYIDLYMVRQLGNQKTDPLSAMLAREWFQKSNKSKIDS